MSGIASHSTGREYIIFSAERSDRTPLANLYANRALDYLSHNFNIVNNCIGYYKEVKEKSIIADAKDEDFVKVLCQVFGQECYLKLTDCRHGHYKATLIYPHKEECIGIFRQVPPEFKKEVEMLNIDRSYINDVMYVITPFESVVDCEIHENFKKWLRA